MVLLLILDTWLSSRQSYALTFSEAIKRTAFWIALGLGMNLWVYHQMGTQAGEEFLACYLLEESLSVDNLFVFLMIFSYFKVPSAVQHRVLFLGVLGAILMRGALIFVGIELVAAFHPVLYLFAILLIVTGLKMGSQGDSEVDPERNFFVRAMRKLIPVTDDYHGASFFVVREGIRYATPLFVVLITIETTDLVFAADSIPAVFGVTKDPFIAFSSNIMAVLGLRATYFALAALMGLFRFLSKGLSLILVAVGVRMLTDRFLDIPISWVLGFIATVLSLSVLASWLIPAPAKIEQDAETSESPQSL